MVKKNAIIMIGCPCSGKSTWIKEYLHSKKDDEDKNDWIVVSRDVIRKNFFYNSYEITEENESIVTSIFKNIILSVKGNKNIIIDNMNITKASIAQILSFIGLDYNINFKTMPLQSIDVYEKRNLYRNQQENKFIQNKVLLEKIDLFKHLLKSEYYEEIIVPKLLREKI